MATGIVTRVTEAQNTGEGTVALNVEVCLLGADVPGLVALITCQMKLTGNESTQQMRTKFTDCIVAGAIENGITVPRTGCMLPSWDRGA